MMIQESGEYAGFTDFLTDVMPDITKSVQVYMQTEQKMEALEQQRRIAEEQRRAAEATRKSLLKQEPGGIPMNVLLLGGGALIGTFVIARFLK